MSSGAQESLLKQKIREEYWYKVYHDKAPDFSTLKFGLIADKQNQLDFDSYSCQLELSKVRSVLAKSDLALFTVVSSALKVLLQQYLRQDFITISSNSFRVNSKISESYPLVLTTEISNQYSFKQVLAKVKENVVGAFQNQGEECRNVIEREGWAIPDVQFLLENLHELEHNDWSHNLRIILRQDDSLDFHFNPTMYHPQWLNDFSTLLKDFLQRIVDCMDLPIRDFNFLQDQKQDQILNLGKGAVLDYKESQGFVHQFEKMAHQYADKICLEFKEQQITYAELNSKSNQLARKIQELGVTKGDRVVLYVNRELSLVQVLLAIFKIGAVYVPADLQYPKDRVNYMLEDCGATYVVTDQTELTLESVEVEILTINSITQNLELYSAANLNTDITSNDSAYIIYTSGSTGKPKGVLVSYGNLDSFTASVKANFKFGTHDVMPFLASHAFDISFFELFGAILSGGKTILLDKDQILDNDKFIGVIEQCTLFHTVPALMSQVVTYLEQNGKVAENMRMTFVGGDAVPSELVPKIQAVFPNAEVKILYGPTEATIFCSVYDYLKTEKIHLNPIGRAIPNSRIFVLDDQLKVCPQGVIGELCVAGTSVTKGYWNRENLNEKKFVSNPYGEGLIYRTGDLAKWGYDGNLYFEGRNDYQVKIRGYRVELGEIQSRIGQHQAIQEVLVLDQANPENLEKYIVAFVVCNPDAFDESELKDHLKKDLPTYMIPSYIIRLDHFPLTSNGKIDRKSLPNAAEYYSGINVYKAPRTEAEKLLVEIWQDVFKKEQIGVSDNFFELGGHSLLANRLITLVREQTNKEASVKMLFANPTIELFAGEFEELETGLNAEEVIPFSDLKPFYLQSSAQSRMWLLYKLDPESVAYNMPMFIKVTGSLDWEKANLAFEKLIKRHSALRTTFHVKNGKNVQQIYEESSFELHQEACESSDYDFLRTFIQPFNLEQGPCFRFKLLKTPNNVSILFCDIHHIIADGISLNILMEEFTQLYHGIELSLLDLEYHDYAEWQQQQLLSGLLVKQRAFWLNQFEDEIPILELPYDFNRPAIQQFDGAWTSTFVDNSLTEQLRHLASDNNTTLFVILLSAYKILLSNYSGINDIIVGTPASGRSMAQVNRMIGMFVNTLVIRSKPDSSKTISQYVKEVAETSMLAVENQEYQLEDLIDDLNLERNPARNPLFSTMFSLLNLESEVIQSDEVKFEQMSNPSGISKFDLSLTTSENIEGLSINFNYATSLFRESTIQRLSSSYVRVLEQLVSAKSIGDIQLLNSEEEQDVVLSSTGARLEIDINNNLISLFSKAALKNPQGIALEYGELTRTFAELEDNSSKLASKFIDLGVSKGDRVVLYASRSLELVECLLAIMKAGAVYVPADLQYPEERVKHIVEDSGAKIIITDSNSQNTYSSSVEELQVKELFKDLSTVEVSSELAKIEPEDNAYIIYTSGSTGKPKGVLVNHGNLASFLQEIDHLNKIKSSDVMPFVASHAFDISFFELFNAMIKGGKTILLDKDQVLEKESLLEVLDQSTLFHTVPALMTQVVRFYETEGRTCSNMRQVYVGGDAVPSDLLPKMQNVFPKSQIKILYGPTEGTIFCSVFDYQEGLVIASNPIGRPIPNNALLILDDEKKLCPKGVIGEIHIAGPSVTKGYWNQQELTEMKYFQSKYSNSLMYATGDLGFWDEQGVLNFKGRKDNQVKIRGYRIEIGEVQSALNDLSFIGQALVLVHKEGTENHLVAYVTIDSKNQENVIGLMDQELRKKLPAYMVPSLVMRIEEFPLTANGKIDIKRLPVPDLSAADLEYVAPESNLEKQLCQIWEEILNVESIGLTHSFFKLGGHSLKAVELLSEIQSTLNVEVPLKELFLNPTVKGIVQYLESTTDHKLTSIPKVDHQEFYVLSPAQKRMFLTHQMIPDSIQYNMPGFLKLDGELNLEKVEEAINKLVARHESLRTSFLVVKNEPVQVVNPATNSKLVHYQVKNVSEAKEHFKKFVQPFDLSSESLFKVEIYQVNSSEHYLAFDMHHIVSDGASMKIITSEFIQLYSGKELTPIEYTYKDFAEWRFNHIQSEKGAEDQKFWLTRYSTLPESLALPLDFKRPSVISVKGGVESVLINKDLTGHLNKLAQENNTTLFNVLLTGLNILFHKYSGQEDLVLGTINAGRGRTEFNSMVGMFVNTIPMRNFPSEQISILSFLQEVVKNTIECHEHEAFPLENLLKELQIERDLSRNPLFDIMFSMDVQENTGDSESGLKISAETVNEREAKFDITVHALVSEDSIRFTFGYRSELFHSSSINKMLESLVLVLQEMATNPTSRIGEISLITESEKQLLLKDFNATTRDLKVSKNIIRDFENVVVDSPNHVALVFEEQSLTYQELNVRANQLANCLLSQGLTKEDVVGVRSSIGLDMVIAELAVLKSGGAVLCIDTKFPEARVQYMLEAANAKFFVTSENKEFLSDSEIIRVATDAEEVFTSSEDNPNVEIDLDNTACIIYTSGSTGKPKGVKTPHRALRNITGWYLEEFGVTKKDHTAKYAGFSFDISNMEIVSNLVAGSTLHLIPEEIRLDMGALNSYLEKNQISIIFIPTQACELFLEQKNNSLRYLLTGGDKLNKFESGSFELVNVYGPTENTIISTTYHVRKNYVNIPVGKPIFNNQVYILDKELKLVPVGMQGEIYLGGDNLSSGYINPEIDSSERFIQNPYFPEQVMYKTGDVGRWIEDGNIEFLGRSDHQIQIRGFRVEPGEIEHVILEQPKITECAVIPYKDGSGLYYLCAYLVYSDLLDLEGLKKHLQEVLPYYMVPSYFIELDQIPLTPNGKIDKQLLPQPDAVGNNLEEEYVAPSSIIEIQLVQIWEQVLEKEQVGVTDNFFRLGGHSLKVIELLGEVSKQLGVEIAYSKLFEFPTVQKLAENFENFKEVSASLIGSSEELEFYPLSPAQQRMFLTTQLSRNSIQYNMPAMLQLEGEIDLESLENAIITLFERHEGFKTSFEMKGGVPVQKIVENVDFELKKTSVDSFLDAKKHFKDFVKPFDLSHPPLLRAEFLKLEKEKGYLMFDMPHIISDGGSMQILTSDFLNLIKGEELEPLSVQYKEYAQQQSRKRELPQFQVEREYWLNQFNVLPETLALPLDFNRPSHIGHEGGSYYLKVDSSILEKLNLVSEQLQLTPFTLVISALSIVLSKYSGQEDLVIGTASSGRKHPDLKRVLGMFVNTLPIRLRPEKNLRIEDYLFLVKNQTVNAFENQDYPFEELVAELDIKRDLARNPLFDVMLNVLTFEDLNVESSEALMVSKIESGSEVAKFDITVSASLSKTNLAFQFNYRKDLFREATIENLANGLQQVLEAFGADQNVVLGDLLLLTSEEFEEIRSKSSKLDHYNIVGNTTAKHEFSAPKSQTEIDLYKIWTKVLEKNDFGIDDSFFELGGHSLRGATVIASAQNKWTSELRLLDLFEYPTVRTLALKIDQLVDHSMGSTNVKDIPLLPNSDFYEVSAAQKRLWLLDKILDGSSEYNMTFKQKLPDDSDLKLVKQALISLVERHETLRTSFQEIDGVPMQKINAVDSAFLQVIEHHDSGFELLLENHFQQEVNHDFNLEKGPLFRCALLTGEQSYLIFNLHHIITDGWSLDVLRSDFKELYESLVEGRDHNLPELKVQYKEFGHWQNKRLASDEFKAAKSYWHNALSGELPVLQLPVDYAQKTRLKNSGSSFSFSLSSSSQAKMNKFIKGQNSSLFMFLNAALKITLFEITGQQDLIIGTPSAGRTHEQLKYLNGFFLNTLVLRSQIDPEFTFEQFYREIKKDTVKALEYQEYPFEQLVEELNVPRDLNRFPIASVFLNVLNYGETKNVESHTKDKKHRTNDIPTKFDLNIYVSEFPDGIGFNCLYKNELYRPESIELIFEKFEKLIDQIVDHPSIKIQDVLQRNVTWTGDVSDMDWYSPERNLIDRFEFVAKQYSGRLAIGGRNELWTYKDLLNKVNAVVKDLIDQNIFNQPIGISCSHDERMVIALLAVLKSGNHYVPIDPSYPNYRIEQIIKTVDLNCLITDEDNESRCNDFGVQFDHVWILDSKLPKEEVEVTTPNLSVSNLAYILFTSGSTGVPKAIAQTHGAVMHFISNYSTLMEIDSNDRLTGFSSINFDSFVNDVFGALLNGASYWPHSFKNSTDLVELGDWLIQNNITIWHSVPSVFKEFANSNLHRSFDAIQTFKMTGEATSYSNYQLFESISNEKAKFVVSYGSTESTLNTFNQFTRYNGPVKNSLSAGKPVGRTEIKILSEHGTLVGDLSYGEILVYSPYVTSGYLDQEVLNEASFIQIDGKRFFKTGDLGRFNVDGELEVSGRKDFQVKIRGVRIDVQEVQHSMTNLPQIEQAVVLNHTKEGDDFLIGYYIGEETDFMEIRTVLATRLPEVMIPTDFVLMDKFPRTPNGKIDRSSFPSYNLDGIKKEEFEQPFEGLESELAAIWKELLQVDQVGRNSNFFQLGGHSLKATQFAAKFKAQEGLTIPLRVLFENPTIKMLASAIQNLGNGVLATSTLDSPIESPVKDLYSTTAAQNNFYFLHHKYPDSNIFNMPSLEYLGSDVEYLSIQEALELLIERHEPLRTSFVQHGQDVMQKVHDWVDFKLEHVRIKSSELDSVVTKYTQPFYLDQAPLYRAALVETDEQQFYLFHDIHHIISDGSSRQRLTNEFKNLLKGEILPTQGLQYKDYSEWINEQLKAGNLNDQREFWLKKLSGKLPSVALETDYPRGSGQYFEGGMYNLELDSELTDLVREFCAKNQMTLYMVLLAGYQLLLHKQTGEKDIIIGSPVAGRTEEAFQNTMGLFISTVLMRNKPKPELSFIEFINQVKKESIQAFENQLYPYDVLLNDLQIKTEPGRNPLTDFSLIVQNMLGKEELNNVSALDDTFEVTNSAKVDLTMYAFEHREKIMLRVEYKSSLYKPETIKSYLRQFKLLLKEGISNPKRRIGDLSGGGNNKHLAGLSHAQRRIYFTEKIYENTSVNNTAFLIGLSENVDHELLKEAFRHVVNQNQALRLRIKVVDGNSEPYQYVSPPLDEINVESIKCGLNGEEHLKREVLEPFAQTTFNLEGGPLFAFKIVEFKDQTMYLVNLHHLIGDGWTIFLVCDQVYKALEVLKSGDKPHSEPLPDYLDFVENERKYLNSDASVEHLKFWKQHLLPIPERSSFIPAPKSDSLKSDHLAIAFESNIRQDLLRYCEESGMSLYKILLTALSVFLRSYNENYEDEVIIGGVNHGRSSKIDQDTSGMFVSTIPVKVKVEQTSSFDTLLQEVSDILNPILKQYQKYPFDLLAEELRRQHNIDANELLNVNLIGHQDVHEDRYSMQYGYPGYDSSPLSIHINESNKNIKGILELTWSYQKRFFDKDDIESLHQRFVMLLSNLISKPKEDLSRIALMDQNERDLILTQFNNLSWKYSNDSVVQQFEKQVEQSSDKVALKFEDRTMTYFELNSEANKVAHYLIQKGAGRDTLVGILMEPGFEMFASIWGILKSGAAYLPLDPEYPQDRVEFILNDAQPLLVITDKETIRDSRYVFYNNSEVQNQSSGNPKVQFNPESLSYVIYTSGTTGQPKGCLIEHRNLSSYVEAFQKEFALNHEEVVLQQTRYTFDAFVEEFYPAQLVGGQIVIAKREQVTDLDQLEYLLRSNKVSMITCSPLLLNELNKLTSFQSLKICISGGDVLKPSYVSNLKNYATIYNTYGPTEGTVCVTYQKYTNHDTDFIQIGKPINNTYVLVLDEYLRLQPTGVPGELVIGGAGVARSYLNREKLTHDRFIQSPFDSKERLYRTGDLVQWNHNGELQFLGRTNDQVKIRGYRIEPQEIEQCLLEIAEVKEAVVVALEQDNQEKFLCAYLVGDGIKLPDVKPFLRKSMPEYMIPTHVMEIDSIPLTRHLKVDKKALPLPELNVVEVQLPTNHTEQKLVQIWSEVLGVDQERLSTVSSFFDVGGHSLKAMSLVNSIKKHFAVNITLANVFNNPTIQDLAIYIIAQNSSESKDEFIPRVFNADAKYELSAAQQRMYFLNRFDEQSTFYNMPAIMEIEGELDVNKVIESFQGLVDRHESLRSNFIAEGEHNYQVINDRVNLTINVHSVTEEEAEDIVKSFVRPFNLADDVLIRVEILRIATNRHVLLVDLHHIISDGNSIQILVKEFKQGYAGVINDTEPLQYKEFAHWQNDRRRKGEFEQLENYWKGQLDGELPLLQLPLDYSRPKVQKFNGNDVSLSIPSELLDKFKTICADSNVTLFAGLLSIYKILLSKYTGQYDLIVGIPSAGRVHSDLDRTIGMFVNSLAIRTYPDVKLNFNDYLNQVAQTYLAAIEHEEYQFEEIIELLDVPRDPSRNPIFETMFSLLNYREQEPSKENKIRENLILKPFGSTKKVAKFDLSLDLRELKDQLVGTLTYATHLFDKQTIQRMADGFVLLLESIVAEPKSKISDLSVVAVQSITDLVPKNSHKNKVISNEKVFVDLIQNQANLVSDNVALKFRDVEWTYSTLFHRVNVLAAMLGSKYGLGDRVVVHMSRGPELTATILALLKLGLVYIPIDVDYPTERKEYILNDSKAKLIISNVASGLNMQSIDQIDLTKFNWNQEATINARSVKHSDIAYVIYTSGSTGKPKGVEVSHGNLFNFASSLDEVNGLTENDLLPFMASNAFDISFFEQFAALLKGGGTLILEKEDLLDSSLLVEKLKVCTVFHTVPALMRQIVDSINTLDIRSDFNHIKQVCLGGDLVPNELLHDLTSTFVNAKITVFYGPTEATVFCTAYDFDPKIELHGNVIGNPTSNNQILILDDALKAVPHGVWGEICIGGPQVTQGYLHREELTKDRFIENPYDQGVVYRSGDLGRWNRKGELEFGGRKDSQVKIRGYRIELGEIESAINQLEGVGESLVIVTQNTETNDKLIVAYVRDLEDSQGLSEEFIRDQLRHQLPEYMIPSIVVLVESFELTQNGKINRRKLPDPFLALNEVESGVLTLPSTKLEKALVNLWTRVLGVDVIGMESHFFQIGGHSLKATQLSNLVREEMNLPLSIKDIFLSPVLKDQVELLKINKPILIDPIRPLEPQDSYPLSHAQQMLWVSYLREGASSTFNIPLAFNIQGQLNFEAFERMIFYMVQRHEILRTRIIDSSGVPSQIIEEPNYVKTELVEIDQKELKKALSTHANQSLDLLNDVLFKVSVFKVDDNQYAVGLNMHHIISDGWSMELFMKEAMQVYATFDAGKEPSLQPLKIQYKDFASWHNALIADGSEVGLSEFWKNKFSGKVKPLQLPTFQDRPTEKTYKGDRHVFELSIEESRKLTKLVKHHWNTSEFIVMQTVMSILLYRYSGQNDIVIGTPVSGRNRAELQNQIGYYVNMLALRNEVQSNHSFIELLQEVKAQTLEVFDRQDYPFDKLLDDLKPERDDSRLPLVNEGLSWNDFGDLSEHGSGDSPDQVNDLTIKPVSTKLNFAKYDLWLYGTLSREMFRFAFEYNTDLFTEEQVKEFSEAVLNIIKEVVRNPEIKIAEIKLVEQTENTSIEEREEGEDFDFDF